MASLLPLGAAVTVTVGAMTDAGGILGASGAGATFHDNASTNAGHEYLAASTDTMQFSKTDFANFAALHAHLTQSGANAVMTLNASDTVALTGVTASTLTAGQFSFV